MGRSVAEIIDLNTRFNFERSYKIANKSLKRYINLQNGIRTQKALENYKK